MITFFFIALIFISIEVPLQKKNLNKAMAQTKILLRTLVERDKEPLSNEIFDRQVRAIKIRLTQMSSIEGIVGIYVYDETGNLIENQSQFDIKMHLTELEKKISNGVISMTRERINDIDLVIYFQEIRLIGERIGFIKILYSIEELKKTQQFTLIKNLFLLSLILLAMLFILNLILSRAILKPLMQLRDAINQMTSGKLGQKVQVKTKDEIGQLSRAFNRMSSDLFKSHRDLDQQNQALIQSEEELADSAQRLSIHIEHTPLGVVEWDLNFKVTQWNKSAENIFGYTKDEAIGKSGFELIIPNNIKNQVQSIWDDLINLKGGTESTNENVTKDGKVIICEWYNTPLLDHDGKGMGVASLVQDITERKQIEKTKSNLESQLRQAQKMEAIGTLAGGIAHDFNNILGPILGYAELLKGSLPPDSKALKHQHRILESALRAKDLVQQILLFSRQTGNELRPVQPHLGIKEALKLLRSSIPTTIEFRENIRSDCGAILADLTQLHQIVMNLCTNAYHAMRESGGILGITLSKIEIKQKDFAFEKLELTPGKYIKLEVSDTGHGMTQATVDKIFDPYFTTKPEGEGTGLGLSVVLGIVKSFNGQIKIYSEPGEGTTVNVYFPRLESGTDIIEGQEDEPIPTGTERILVVDDEEYILDMTKTMLEDFGYKVYEFISSRKALAEFQSDPNKFDLVITDMTMPHMTGLEMIKQVFAIRPKMPVILCTEFSAVITEEKAIAFGIKGFLTKPILKKEMAKTIRKVLKN